jgi:hypothetical protein
VWAELGVHRRNAWETDSKSVARKGVGVQVPPGAPSKIKHLVIYVGRGGDRRLATIRQPSGGATGRPCPRSFFGCSAPSEWAMSFASTFGAYPQWPGGQMLPSCYRHGASATRRPRHSGPMPRRMLNAPMRRTLSAVQSTGRGEPWTRAHRWCAMLSSPPPSPKLALAGRRWISGHHAAPQRSCGLSEMTGTTSPRLGSRLRILARSKFLGK